MRPSHKAIKGLHAFTVAMSPLFHGYLYYNDQLHNHSQWPQSIGIPIFGLVLHESLGCLLSEALIMCGSIYEFADSSALRFVTFTISVVSVMAMYVKMLAMEVLMSRTIETELETDTDSQCSAGLSCGSAAPLQSNSIANSAEI